MRGRWATACGRAGGRAVGQPRCVALIIIFGPAWGLGHGQGGNFMTRLLGRQFDRRRRRRRRRRVSVHTLKKIGRKHTIGNRSAAATQAETVNRSEKRIEESQAKRSETRRTTADCSQLTTEIENSAEQSAKRRRRRRSRHCCCCLPSQRRERGNRDRLQSACPSPSSKPAATQRAN